MCTQSYSLSRHSATVQHLFKVCPVPFAVVLARRWKYAAAGLYLLGAIAACVGAGIPLTPDRIALLLLPAVLLLGVLWIFLRDWLPFLFVLFAYEYLRGFGARISEHVHYLAALRFDRLLFGVVPTQFLQQHLFDPPRLHPWDYAATLVYFMHFVAPVTFGFWLWLRRRDRFIQFSAALLALSFVALLTYVAFPAAPPWLAAQDGLLPGVHHVLEYTLRAFPQRLQVPTVYALFDPDEVAAVPSLHAGYSALIALFAIRFHGRRGALLVGPYPLLMSLSIVYLGEHYVADVLLGFCYAGLTFAAIVWAFGRLPSSRLVSSSSLASA